MLLLVTILLVLVAAVTLLIGIFSDELTLIFVSIGASALAAIVLAVLSQMSRKKGRAAASEATAPEPLPARQTSSTPASDATAEAAAVSIETTGEPVDVPADATAEQPTTVVPAVADLAIENYDSLRVNEILPKLEGLDLDELEDIAQHEESRKNRTTVLNRIDALMDQLEAAAPESEVTDELAAEAVASIEEIGEPVVAIADDAEDDTADDATADDGFPIPNYDSLSEAELIPLLADLDADQLEAVADREEAGPNRDAVLDAIDDRLDILEGIVPAPAATSAAADDAAIEEEEAADELPVEVAVPAATRAPARKATAKKAAARKVAAAPAKKAATTASRATAAKKAVPAKATAKAKKAPAARAVKAAPAVKKAPTTTAKKAAAKKALAKKATAAKKAAKR